MSDETRDEMDLLGMHIVGSNPESGDVEAVSINPSRVAHAQAHFIDTLEKYVRPLNPLYIETLIALANLYCAVSREYLRACPEVVVFQLSRDQVLDVLGRASAHINGLPMGVDQLLDADTPTETVN